MNGDVSYGELDCSIICVLSDGRLKEIEKLCLNASKHQSVEALSKPSAHFLKATVLESSIFRVPGVKQTANVAPYGTRSRCE